MASTVGHLELLWHFTAKQAPAGDVGRWADDEIAEACDWDGDPAAFVDALVAARWLDPCPTHRLIVHDWHEHADDALRKAMRRRDASLRGVRWEDSEACFARPVEEIPESLRSLWREWQTTADSGGHRPDSGGQRQPFAAFPAPPSPARPGPASSGPPPDGGQRPAKKSGPVGRGQQPGRVPPPEPAPAPQPNPPPEPPKHPPLPAADVERLNTAADVIHASALRVPGLLPPDNPLEWPQRRSGEAWKLYGICDRLKVTPEFVLGVVHWLVADPFWQPKVPDTAALERQWKSILGAMNSRPSSGGGGRDDPRRGVGYGGTIDEFEETKRKYMGAGA